MPVRPLCVSLGAVGPLLAATLGLSAAAGANEYVLPPGEEVVGQTVRVQAAPDDTFTSIAQRHGAGFDEMKLANPKVDAWLPKGTVVVPTRFVLPDAPRDGVILNVAELRLYYFPPAKPGESRRVLTYPVSVGRMDWQTPLGTTKVVRKAANPIWTPPESIRREAAAEGLTLPPQVLPGPDNPLGPFALYLGVPGYLLHGTDERKQAGIGIMATHGCVRMYNEDVESLYGRVPVGTPVHLVDQPYKVGWSDGVLYLEAHPPFGEDAEGDVRHLTDMVQIVLEATRQYPDYPIDWKRAEAEVQKPSGIPVPIGPRTTLRARAEGAAAGVATQPAAALPPGGTQKAVPVRPAAGAGTGSVPAKPAPAARPPATASTKTASTKKETPPQRGSQSNRPAP
jgi:L,D-transpeptidase ErfK/SrfK